MLIINADDFGFDSNANRAIVRSFEQGLCSSTTVMANMPGFEEACCLAQQHRLVDHVGVHLVMNVGTPLTEGIKKYPRFCERDGLLALSVSARHFTLETSEKHVLASEIRAQISRCRANGIAITHLDSHHHLHTRWAVLAVVLAVAQSEHVPFARMAQNCGPRFTLKNDVYKCVVNFRIMSAGYSRTRYFCGLEEGQSLKEIDRITAKRKSLEVMVHPLLNEQGFVIDAGSGHPLATLINLFGSPSKAVSYSGARFS